MIKTVRGLIKAHKEKNPGSHFFDKNTLEFFGESISSMELASYTTKMADARGEVHECYVLTTMQNKHPSGPRKRKAYFDVETLDHIVV